MDWECRYLEEVCEKASRGSLWTVLGFLWISYNSYVHKYMMMIKMVMVLDNDDVDNDDDDG